jgi:hypothetical protein
MKCFVLFKNPNLKNSPSCPTGSTTFTKARIAPAPSDNIPFRFNRLVAGFGDWEKGVWQTFILNVEISWAVRRGRCESAFRRESAMPIFP